MYKKYFKRLFDIFCALLAVVCFWWLFLIIALLVKFKLGSPVIFSQKRPGKDGKIFTLYKFRTMTDEKDENGNLKPDEIRLVKFGKMLRKTSLDELPEVINILMGDMSVVGPRPLLVQYLPLYNEFEARRHEVRPGLSGWAQVNGRNCISWQEKFKFDVEYIEKISFLFDIKIIFMTVGKVFVKKEGINQQGEKPMDYFEGSGL